MAGVISHGDAIVIAAVITLLGTVIGAWLAFRSARSQNTREHAENSSKLDTVTDKVDRVLEAQGEFRHEVSYIRGQVSDIRQDVASIHGELTELRCVGRSTDARVTRLERHRTDGGDAA